MVRIYHLASCDTCRKALKVLRPFSPDEIEIRRDGIPADKLEQMLAAIGAETLVNRRSTTWRGLDEETRELPAIELLQTHPTLMKRPVFEHNDEFTVGWSNEIAEKLLSSLR